MNTLISTVGIYAWTIDEFLTNLKGSLQNWGGGLLMVIGVAALVWGIIQIVTGLMSGGKKQINWLYSVGAIVLGGAFAFGGWTLAESVGTGLNDSVTQLGGGILTMLPL